MSDFHSDYKQQLLSAADALFAPQATRPARRLRRTRRVPLLAVIAFGVLLLAAAAFAATRIIGVGSPVTATRPQERPSVSTGVGIPVPGARNGHVSAQLLAISVADPAGGLPWGMRVVRTTRGLVCLQVGRLLNGRLGVLGQDGEFHNDGLFHELPAGVLDPDTCSQPADFALYNSEGLPAAGALPGPARPCLYPGAPRQASDPRPCPVGDERMIAFGVLGPHAVSVSYRHDGAAHTVATSGTLGAYLVVLRQPSSGSNYSFPTLNSSAGRLGHFPIETESSAISTLLFRFRHRVCHAGGEREAGGLPACTTAIAHTPEFWPLIAPGLHSRIDIEGRKAPGGYDLDLTFIAPATVRDASTAYAVQVTMPSGPACGHGGIGGQSIERDLGRGQIAHITQFVGQAPGCQPDAFTGPVDAQTIGRFSFELP
jgi:hypothetical protein